MSKRTRRAQRDEELTELHETIRTASTPRLQNPGNQINLGDLVEPLQRNTIQPRQHYKLPEYNGEGDIDLFLLQFNDVMAANQWTERDGLLHLRLSLTSKALECGRGESLEQITNNLIARFGTTTKQARDKLKYIRKTPQISIHELGIEIDRLINLAYPRIEQEDRNEMAIDVFSKAIDNKPLQRHLLARPPDNIAEAIRTTEEFLQVGGDIRPPRIATIYEEEEGEDKSKTKKTPDITETIVQTLQSLQTTMAQQQAAIQQQAQILHHMQGNIHQTTEKYTTQNNTNRFTNRPPLACYECNGPHIRRNCPRLRTRPTNNNRQSGNDHGPTQPMTQFS